MLRSLLIDDPRYCRLESVQRLTSTIEQYVRDLESAAPDDKLVRVLVTVGDTDGERRRVKPQLALILDLDCPRERFAPSGTAATPRSGVRP